MKYIIQVNTLFILILSLSFGCKKNNIEPATEFDYPTVNHDLSYIPFDSTVDNPDFIVCDSTAIGSGRNRLQYIGGINKLTEDISSQFSQQQKYDFYDGYIVIRFIVNCDGKSGRYRAQALNLDFSQKIETTDILEYTISLIQNLDHWAKYIYI